MKNKNPLLQMAMKLQAVLEEHPNRPDRTLQDAVATVMDQARHLERQLSLSRRALTRPSHLARK
jgi:hypothetical protein